MVLYRIFCLTGVFHSFSGLRQSEVGDELSGAAGCRFMSAQG